MKNFKLIGSIFLISIAFIFSSCKDDSLIGNNIMPPGDGLYGTFTDTLTLTSQTVLQNPLKTSNTSQSVIGSMNDPVFGKSVAGVYAQVLLPSNNIDLGRPDTLSLDSLVLTLDYNGFYGDEAQPMNVKVFQVTQDLNASTEYYSDQNFSFSPISIGEKDNFIPQMKNRMIVLGDTLDAHMRIRLSDRVGKWMLGLSQSAGLASNASFLNIFKGLFIVGDTSNGFGNGFAYVNMTSAISRLTLYYHSAHIANKKFNFPITTSSTIVNHYQHNFNSTEVADSLASTFNRDSINYLQSMSGTRTKVTIPNLKNLGKVLINKAELEITALADPNNTADSIFTTPLDIIVVRGDSAGNNSFTPDQTSTYLAFGGSRKTETNSAGQKVYRYRVSIADQVQNLIDDATTDYGLYVIILGSPQIADRVIIGGANRSDDYKMKLNVIYTKIK